MSTSGRLCATALLLIALLPGLAIRSAHAAICPPGVPFFRYVGNTATDAQCTDNDIQSAIDHVVCPATTIVVSRTSYSAQHLTVSGKTFTMVGAGNVACGSSNTGAAASPDAVPTTPQVTLSGAGNGGTSVLTITGSSNVTLKYFEITGGVAGAGSHGGGINFNGTGSLTLDTTTVDTNSANFGGGIEINGGGADATLILGAYTIIESNTAAGNGGGINIEGFADLIATSANTLIAFNHAPSGHGGGIAIVGPAHAEIASPGYGTLAVLYGNDAAFGGGMSASASSNSDAGSFTLYTTDPAQPVAASGNFASQAGGGIYLKAYDAFGGGDATAYACLYDFRIDGNAAPDGAAIYAASDSSFGGTTQGSIVFMNASDFYCNASTPGVQCAAGVACNTLDNNQTKDGLNQPTPGSVIMVEDNGLFLANRMALRNNSVAHGVRLAGPGTANNLTTCLIADNAFSAETFQVDDSGGGGDLNINNCTIANNTHNSGSVFRTGVNLTIDDSIIDQPAMSSVSTVGTPAIFADNVLAADPTGLPVQANIVLGEPIFRDAAHGDYHQQAFKIGSQVTASLGIDFAPPVSGDDRDLNNDPYDQDVPGVANAFGVRDLGCYEAQPISDRVFGDGFGDPLSLVH